MLANLSSKPYKLELPLHGSECWSASQHQPSCPAAVPRCAMLCCAVLHCAAPSYAMPWPPYLHVRLALRVWVVLWPLSQLFGDDVLVEGHSTAPHLRAGKGMRRLSPELSRAIKTPSLK